jgi:hypothetical protein
MPPVPEEDIMNAWKPIAIVAVVGLVASVGVQIARAGTGDGSRPPIVGGVCHDQPNMANAAASLKQARAYLDKAEHNKGGWRVAAIDATNKAITETDRGCAFADTH